LRLRADPIDLRRDGTFANFLLPDLGSYDPRQCVSDWRLTRSVTRYSRYGSELEEADIRDVRSAGLYGHRSALPIALALHAGMQEIGFEGFEEYRPGQVV